MPEVCNIARHLPAMAALHAQRAAIKIPRGTTRAGDIDYLSLSFSELEAEAALWQQRLQKAGINRGDRTLVMVKPGLPLIASIFALFATGAVPVVIDPGMGLRSFLSCVKRSRPDALVGIPLALLISRLSRGSFRTVRSRLGASTRLDGRLSKPGATDRITLSDTKSGDAAAILFTSGSTGAPKGVCYEHGMFEAQVRLVRETYAIRPGEIDMPLLPVFALFNPALGMTTIVPEINPSKPATVNPERLVRAIQQEQVSNSFGSPTLWGKISDYCIQNSITLPSLKRVLCAGAPVPASLWNNSSKFLSKGQLHSPYGATEALPVSSIDAGQAKASDLRGAPVGNITAGVEVRVIRLKDAPISSLEEAPALPTGEIGEIIVSGPMVTRAYDALPEATAAAKIPDDSRNRVWHRMGDTGFIDQDGSLWFCGRKAERVTTKQGPLFTEPCERIFRLHPRVGRCALVGLGEAGQQTPALVVEVKLCDPRREADFRAELLALAKSHDYTKEIACILFHPSFPVDVRHNAKIHRLSLAKWAATKTAGLVG